MQAIQVSKLKRLYTFVLSDSFHILPRSKDLLLTGGSGSRGKNESIAFHCLAQITFNNPRGGGVFTYPIQSDAFR